MPLVTVKFVMLAIPLPLSVISTSASSVLPGSLVRRMTGAAAGRLGQIRCVQLRARENAEVVPDAAGNEDGAVGERGRGVQVAGGGDCR